MTINKWLENELLKGRIKEDDVIAIYDKNNNLEYLGKADFAPLNLWDEFKSCKRVGNEWHVNERCVTLPVNYVEVKENGKRKFQQVTAMVTSLDDCIDYVKTCKEHALEHYNKDFIYRITTIYDNNERKVTII